MPNVYTAIMPKILAQALMTLRETCVMPQLVNGDYSTEARNYGDTIDVPIPALQAVADVVPGATPPTPASKQIDTVQIKLDKWKKTEFFLTDKEMQEINARQNFIPLQTGEAVRSLANQVNADILLQYKGIYGYTGSAGSTPFASDTAAAIQARKVLAMQLCPKTMRRFVINADAEANALALAAFQDADKAGTDITKREGEIGRKFGFDWFMEDATPTHTSTSLTAGNATVNGAHAAGVKVVSVAKATNASPLVTGDIISFAGDSQTYVVTADVNLSVGNTNVSIYPGLKTAKSGGELMTLRASHVVNMAFHRDAFAFANRPATDGVFTGANLFLQMTDPKTGLSMALEVSRQYHQTVWEFSMLYGTKLVRAELATRVAG